jgi:two-component system, NtrC family, response regulator AtoC
MRLLLVEDKDTFRRLLVQALAGSGWDVLAVGNPSEALEALERSPFEVLVTDLRLPGFSGLELLRRAKRMRPGIRVVLMSAFGEPKDIVEAMRLGADEFLPKPFDLDHFYSVLEHLLALSEAPPPDPREPWIVQAPVMKALDQALSKAADSNASVLFIGEKGVGKLRTARRLHALWNPQGPFLAVSATSLPDERHRKLFSQGSLYLTDLEELSTAHVQGLLDIMKREESIRWMGGAHSLQELPESLRLRLGVLCFQLPPLRDRKEDVLPLFRSFLEAAVHQEGRSFPLVERSVERELLQRAWPGNIRELAWCATQALRTTQGAILASLPPPVGVADSALCIPLPEPSTLEAMLSELMKVAEPSLLRRALESHNHDPSASAAALGLTTRSFAQRLREYRIPLDKD